VLGLSLLVVDDNATSRRILKDLLNHWGMQPNVVEGGSALLAALDAATLVGEPFGLLLLGAHMPQTDGFMLSERTP
jgi:CheY-like chemotaxis protein